MNTPRTSPSGPLANASSQQTEVWVDDVNGSDINRGMQFSPFKSLTKALEAVEDATGDVVIHLMPHGDEEGYDMSALSQRGRAWTCDRLIIRGEGRILSEPMTLASYDFISGDSAPVSTFTGQTWDADSQMGRFLYDVTNDRAISILGNGSDTITARLYDDTIGRQFCIAEPAVSLKVNCDFTEFSDGYYQLAEIQAAPMAGHQLVTGRNVSDASPKAVLCFDNIHLRIPDDQYAVGEYDKFTLKVNGAVAFGETLFSKNNVVLADVVVDGFVSCAGLHGMDSSGRAGLGCIDRGGNQKPGLILTRTVGSGVFAGGPLQLTNASAYQMTYTGINDEGRNDFELGRNAAISIGLGSQLRAQSSSGHLRIVGHGDYAVWLSGASTYWVYACTESRGDQQMFMAEGHSKIMIGYGDLLDEGSDRSCQLFEGSQLIIHENSYENLGDVILGHVGASTRAAAAWSAGDVFVQTPVDSSKCSALRYS